MKSIFTFFVMLCSQISWSQNKDIREEKIYTSVIAPENEDSTFVIETIKQYDSLGNLTQHIFYDTQKIDSIIWQKTTTYDIKNRPKETVFIYKKDTLTSHFTYRENKNNLLTYRSKTGIQTATDTLVEESFYTYNNKNLLIQKLDLKNGTDSSITTYAYDSKNRLAKEHMIDLSYTLLVYKSDTETRYFLNRRKTKSIQYSGWTTVSIWETKKTYNSNNILQKKVERIGNSRIVTKYVYSEKKLLKIKEIHPFKIRLFKGIEKRKTKHTVFNYNENNLIETESTEAFYHYNANIKKHLYKYW